MNSPLTVEAEGGLQTTLKEVDDVLIFSAKKTGGAEGAARRGKNVLAD